MKSAALLSCALVLLPSASRACLNDRDSLETEARGVPDVMRALSGRFERNPPLFYQMRLSRVARELQASPTRLDLYDDAAVACDRLSRDDEALVWIEKKRARLQVLDAKNPSVREHWYRYYANAGTFHVHRWIASGADRRKLNEVKIARNLIARAVAIKPGAHFGREKYQLKAMEWILDPPSAQKAPEELPDFLGLSREDYVPTEPGMGLIELKERGYEDAERGLSGLITLGAAWQSIDVFNSLRYVEAWRGDRTVAYMLSLRLQEMARAGRASLHPQALSPQKLAEAFEPANASRITGMTQLYGGEAREVNAAYRNLREEANDWHARRTSFMLERLRAGRHPDTDPSFWNGWDDGAPPALPKQSFWQSEYFLFQVAPRILLGLVLSLPVGIIGAIIFWSRRRNRRRMA